jgi:hypothetical protein
MQNKLNDSLGGRTLKGKSTGGKALAGTGRAWQARNSSRQARKVFALFLALMLSLGLLSPAVFAQGGDGHAPDCSSSEGSACLHVHDEACGGLVDPAACTHTHDATCGYSEAVACDCAGPGGGDEAPAGEEEVPAGEEGTTGDDDTGTGGDGTLPGDETGTGEGAAPSEGDLALMGGELFPLAADPVVTFMTWKAGDNADNPAGYTDVFSTQTVTSGATCTNPGTPGAPTGPITYVFSGWYLPGEASAFNFSTTITTDITLQARFTPNWNVPVQVATPTELNTALSTATAGQAVVIELTASITCPSTFVIPAGKTIKLTSAAGGPYTISGNWTYTVLQVNSATLTLENIVIANGFSTEGGGIFLNGTLIIGTGAHITGNSALFTGGAIFNEYSGCAVVMYGGLISDNTAQWYYGGGVYLQNSAFTMYGGSITGNSAGYGGGVFMETTTFNMYGGSIAGNSAVNAGGGVYQGGKPLNMYGGDISGNTAPEAAGVCSSYSTFSLYGGSILFWT